MLGPFFGLMGTVVGVIKTVQHISVYEPGDSQNLGEGISIALVTTEIGIAAGLLGVIALIVGHVLTFGKIENDAGNAESEKSYAACVLLNLFLGFVGTHHFYVGRIGFGIFYLLTLGGFFIGQYIDFVNLAWGKFTDSKGKRIRYRKGASPATP